MSDEAAFLRAILAEPSDNATRLVYADWLDQQGQPDKAEFLRITATPPPSPLPPRLWARAASWFRPSMSEPSDSRLPRLQELAAQLDTDWLAVVSRPEVEGCPQANRREEHYERSAGRPGERLFRYVCDRDWADLTATNNVKMRYCDACRQEVLFCDTIMEAREFAAYGVCVAVDLGILRRENDLQESELVVGMFDSDSYPRSEEERLRPDPVSEARQRRKDAGAE